jgi:hypothetical protein
MTFLTSASRRPIQVLTGLFLLFLIAGCGSAGANAGVQRAGDGTQSASPSPQFGPGSPSGGPAVVTLRDPTPDQLDVEIGVVMGGYDAQSRDTTRIGVSFQSNNAPVQIVGTASLTCNGQAMSLTQRLGEVPVSIPTATAAGRVYRCTYQVGHSISTFAFTIPQPAVILSPLDGAHLPRGAAITLRYQLSGIVSPLAVGPNGTYGSCSARPNVMQATCDARKLAAGPGAIRLTQATSLQPAETGPSFHSAIVQVTNMTAVLVTWV